MEAQKTQHIHIVAITGSVRPGNFTSKALALAVDEIHKYEGITSQVIDPGTLNLSPPGIVTKPDDARTLQRAVAGATGVILATPEYHGSYSSVIKLVVDNLGFPSGLSGKPVSLLGVAAGQIGAIKALEHLRSVCSHVGSIVLPGPISVAGVRKVFDDEGRCLDEEVEKRIRRVTTNLIDYIQDYISPKICLEDMVRRGSSVV